MLILKGGKIASRSLKHHLPNETVFDEVRILGFGFTPTTYVDNLSWTKVPSPASAAILGCGALMAGRRRR